MPLKAKCIDVWSAEIPDRPGGLAAVLEPVAAAGANLEFLIARRRPDRPGRGVVFLSGLKGSGQLSAAKKAGLTKTTTLAAVRVEGSNKPALGYQITSQLAAAGMNLRGMSASVIGGKFVLFLAFDSSAQANKAVRILSRPARKR